MPIKPTRGLKPKKQIVHFQIHKDMEPKNSSGKLSNIADSSSKVLGKQDYILEFDKQRKNLRVSTENFNLYKDSVATMEIRIKMREEELKQTLKKIELVVVGAEGSSSKFEEKKTIINQITYVNIIKKDLQI